MRRKLLITIGALFRITVLYVVFPKRTRVTFDKLILNLPFAAKYQLQTGIRDNTGVMTSWYTYREKDIFPENSNCKEVQLHLIDDYDEEMYQQQKSVYENLSSLYQRREFVELRCDSEWHRNNNRSYKCLIVYFDSGPSLYGGIIYLPEEQKAYDLRFSGLYLPVIIEMLEFIEFVNN